MDGHTATESLARVVSLLREEKGDFGKPLAELGAAVGADFSLLLMVSPSEQKTWLLEGTGLTQPPAEKTAELASPFLFRQVTLAPAAPYQVLRQGWGEDPFLGPQGASSLLISVHHAEGLHFSLVAGRRGKAAFDTKVGDLFAVLSGYLGLAAERRYLQSEVQRWRDRDPLTGLPVYHSFYDTLRREVSRARRQARRVSLALLSIEGLEAVARHKGRGGADALLKAVADHLSHGLRDNDLVSRYGPCEFGLLLTDVNSSIGLMVADRILRGVNQAFPRMEGGSAFRMGFACYPDEATTTERLIEMCEGALAKARETASAKAMRWKK